MSTIPAYQPVDVAELLRLHERRVALIRQAANEAREDDYSARWGDVLARCATWFSSLPYSPVQCREPGGAFRCTVETAFYAMRLAGGQKFGTNLPSEKRRLIEPQYNHAVFLAAVCSGLDEPHRHFVVLRESDGAEWNPAGHGALTTWLAGARYQLQRRATPLPVERMRTALLAQSLVGQTLLAGYETGVLSELFGAINPLAHVQGNESLVHKVVRQAVAVAADFDRKAQQGVYDPVQYPVPSAMHVAAAVQPVVTPTPAAPAPISPASSTSPVASPPSAAPVVPAPSAATQAPVTNVQVPVQQSTPAPVGGQQPVNAVEASAPRPPVDNMGPEAGPSTEAVANPAATVASAAASDPQLGLPFAGEAAPPPVAVDPSAMRAPAARVDRPAPPASFDEVLAGQPTMIREFFKALREDVTGGKAKVTWTEKGLALPKRLVGSYGVASDTLVEHLRRRGLLVANVQAEIVLAPRAGELIMEREQA
jgi:conjugal transfer pilus assembly protein TraI